MEKGIGGTFARSTFSHMFIAVGLIILFGSIVLGYTMHGGKIAALMQISEFIIIGGSGLGSIVVAYGFKGALEVAKSGLTLLKGNPYKKDYFLDLLRAMYELFVLARKEGVVELEKHAERPEESDILTKYPTVLANHHAVHLLADTLKLVAMGGITTYSLTEMLDMDLESHHEEAMKLPGMLATVGDAMPGFGIVAAVLGVVITMSSIGGPPEEVGQKVAAALVGTFLGILLAYGLFQPLAKATEAVVESEAQYMACIKNGLIAFSRGDVPLICVEFARRNIHPETRPSFSEVEDACRGRNLKLVSTAEAA